MPKITVTKEVSAMIRAAAIGSSFKDTSKELPNGDREIELDDEVYERLKSMQFKGETISDTIMRAMVALRGGKFN